MLNILTAIYISAIMPLVQVPDDPKCVCESIKGTCPCSMSPQDEDECEQAANEILRQRLKLEMQMMDDAQSEYLNGVHHVTSPSGLHFFILEMQPGASTPQ